MGVLTAFPPVAPALLAALPARAETIGYDALDEASKEAIKSACHGWIHRDAADWIAQWFDAVSPLCDLQAGISGYAEQSAVCADGRAIPLVAVMSDDSGAGFTFHSGTGALFTARAATYDARRLLAAIRSGGAGGLAALGLAAAG